MVVSPRDASPREPARPIRPLRTMEVAHAAGVHPNTVRLWERVGYLPPVPRSASGYRQFAQRHVELARLTRLLRGDRWPGHAIHRSATALILAAAAGESAGLECRSAAHLDLVRRERASADAAAAAVARWLCLEGRAGAVDRAGAGALESPMGPTAAVRALGITYDTLRSWERSGLVTLPRDQRTGARLVGAADLERLAVVRALRTAGYSPMAILRMLHAADAGQADRAMRVLADPGSEPDLVTASDLWAATLADQERRACEALALIAALVSAAEPSTSAPGS